MGHDIRLTSVGDFPHYCGDLITADDLVVQRVAIRLRTHRGGWILDASQGLPFIDWSGRKSDTRGVALATKREIEGAVGVKRAECTATINATTRRTTIVSVVVFDDGTQRGLNFAPFGVLGDPLPTVTAGPS